MDSFELNKILGAVLGTCLFLLALNIAAGAMFAPPKPEKPGYAIAVAEPAAAGKGGAAAPAAAAEPIEALLQKASVEKGEASAKKCVACHTFERAARTASVRTSGASSAASAPRSRASIIPPP